MDSDHSHRSSHLNNNLLSQVDDTAQIALVVEVLEEVEVEADSVAVDFSHKGGMEDSSSDPQICFKNFSQHSV